MVESRGTYDWNHTSALMALLININRDPKRGKPAKPSDFNPYLADKTAHRKLRGQELSILKDVFVRNRSSQNVSSK